LGFTATNETAETWSTPETKTASFSSLSVADGESFYIKFSNATGESYDVIAFDDFSITAVSAVPEPSHYALVFAGLMAVSVMVRKRVSAKRRLA